VKGNSGRAAERGKINIERDGDEERIRRVR
jgi:hypothetical protein